MKCNQDCEQERMGKEHCIHCHYSWLSRVLEPKACPSCKRYDYKIKEQVVENATTNNI